eukprot:COSAG03_NODE_429_length_7977_cov_3.949606_11_plen_140_part_00
MRTKFVPMLASLRRLGISILWLTGEVGSSTRPSIESHIRNRMFAGFLARGAAWVVAASSTRRRPSTRTILLGLVPRLCHRGALSAGTCDALREAEHARSAARPRAAARAKLRRLLARYARGSEPKNVARRRGREHLIER